LQEWRRVVDLVFFSLNGRERSSSKPVYAAYGRNAITYAFIKFRSIHNDQLRLLVPLQLEEARLLLHDLAQQEGQ
jgi:hypothetical protein